MAFPRILAQRIMSVGFLLGNREVPYTGWPGRQPPPDGGFLRYRALQSEMPQTAQRPLARGAALGRPYPSQAGNFFATATFFRLTYFGNPSLP